MNTEVLLKTGKEHNVIIGLPIDKRKGLEAKPHTHEVVDDSNRVSLL